MSVYSLLHHYMGTQNTYSLSILLSRYHPAQ